MTATRIIFSDDVSLVISGDLDNVQGSIYEALGNGGWMVIRAEDGPSVSINPQRFLYIEEFNQVEAAAGDSQELEAQSNSRPGKQRRRHRQPAGAR